ncbi:cupredoxin domain-containing protein [Levilactobacillus fuyuanensis]|uniref:Cupredoxin domain-containing protein n=1 Tax=Levilactobacillus fuyuanensis TaxID=2486022 RepID=A0ABW4H3Y6_9LACO|nr:cupredoxin domain-containing protein [Levilactobacillus fuyuanensis]
MTNTNTTQNATVIVNGGYQPDTVVLKQGVPATITFNRINDAGCLDQVQLPDFDVLADLPLNQPQEIVIDTSQAGTYKFACGMDMFRGKVVIEP